MVELRGIQKYFPSNGVTALDNAEFDLRSGEIHALLGENGAGKSTLMHVMAGYLKPGAGHILIDGKEHHFTAPVDALSAGIGMVRQHPHLVPGFTVWEDCILGAEPSTAGIVNRKKARILTQSVSDRWGFDLPLDRNTETLTVSQRQKTAVLALLLRGELHRKHREVRYLIFDEVTAVLSPGETDSLFALFRRLKAEGRGICIISHKLEETLNLADRVSILRRGKTAAVLNAASLDGEKAGKLMFGIEPVEQTTAMTVTLNSTALTPDPGVGDAAEKQGLRVEGLSVEVRGRPFIRNVDLELPQGKILGIAGVRDSGLETLELGITGFLHPSAGKIFLCGQDITGKGPRAFRAARGAYIGATGKAMDPSLRLRDNIIIHAHRRSRRGFRGRFGIMDEELLNSWMKRILEAAKVDRNPKVKADSLSGGMMQRVILAREFAEDAAFLILAEPGWGLDRPGREALARALKQNAAQGKGALIFSTDVDELLSLSDEILVLRNGEFSDRISLGSFRGQEETVMFRELKERISRAMVGMTGGKQINV
ncbi:ATP-binding cassette domain-containing protein [Treponema primitia]|uniref:ATP-binding cassette domain-containing protein n=1 Tax=Treponema primitia TaxID=88058 RepID=UPI00025553D6|nr:ATP-binding cassette domain-containing protein [Treponema primitia]